MNRFFTFLFAASCWTAFGQYEVGDVGPAGGWIFYVDSLDEFDWDYLEVASSYCPVACNFWGGTAYQDPNGPTVDFNDFQAIGMGEFATSYVFEKWIHQSNGQTAAGGTSTAHRVAMLEVLGFHQNGYADWFMPSIEELLEVFSALPAEVTDSFGPDMPYASGEEIVYSSSPMPDLYEGYVRILHLDDLSVGFILGNVYPANGNGGILVLPIRAFRKSEEDACGLGTFWDPISQSCIVDESACGWQPDGNGDNLIGVNDLLDLLGVYGDTDYDQDGIWDSADDCVGEYDECGVCNGSGPSIPIIESIEILYDSVYAEPIDEWLVFEVGADTTYQYVCGLGCTDPLAENYNDFADTDDGSCFYTWACGNPLEYQGYEYETVLIGQQCWFAENLATPFYQSGGTIPLAGDQYTPGNWRTPYGFGNQSCTSSETYFDACNPSESIVRYGLLYNHQTAMSGICPNGWKLPSNIDWEVLLAELGDENPADELKSEQYWNGDNGSQFNAVPAGNRNDFGGFYDAGQSTRFWSSDIFEGPPYYGTSWSFEITNSSAGLTPIWISDWGHSVRCLQDAE